MKIAILVDEINAVNQLHNIGIEGINPWKSFYTALEQILRADYPEAQFDFNIYGAIIPKHMDIARHCNRNRFFQSLKRDGIQVHEGYCVKEGRRIAEKGVDVSIALDLFQYSLEGYSLLLVFSGDTDIVPAVYRAKSNGARVSAILSRSQPAKYMIQAADSVISLESILKKIPSEHIVRRKHSPKAV